MGSLSIQIIQKSNQAWIGLAVCSTQCCSAYEEFKTFVAIQYTELYHCTDAVETDFLFANIDFKRSYFILSIAFCPINLQIYF